MKFLPEEIFDKLSFETNLTELISYCKSEDEIVECFNAAVKRINEDWTLFTPKVKSKLLIGIETFGLTEYFGNSLHLASGDKELLSIRWEIADMLYFEKKKEAIEDLKKYGLNIENHTCDFSYYTYPEILENGKKIILDLLRSKIEIDFAVILVCAPKTAEKNLHQITDRVYEEYVSFLIDARMAIYWLSGAPINGKVSDTLAKEIEEALQPYKDAWKLLCSNISTIRPSKTLFREVRELIKNDTQNTTIMGDNFVNISGNVSKNSSGPVVQSQGSVSIEGSFIQDKFGKEAADALTKVAEIINQSNNSEAKELFESMSQELKTEKPKKSILATLWNGITSAVPLIKSSIEIFGTVSSMIHNIS